MRIKANPPLTFKEAIIECFKKSFKISGRSRRSEFWNFFLFFFIQIIIFYIIELVRKRRYVIIMVILSIFMCFTAFSLIVVTIRRLHDVGKSQILMLINIIPIVGNLFFLGFLLQDSDKGKNKYGYSPKYYDVFDNSLNNNDQLDQMNMLQPIDPQIDPNINPSQMMEVNDAQIVQNPQGISISIPLNLSNMYILNQPQQMPPLVQNENYEPGIYQNNF